MRSNVHSTPESRTASKELQSRMLRQISKRKSQSKSIGKSRICTAQTRPIKTIQRKIQTQRKASEPRKVLHAKRIINQTHKIQMTNKCEFCGEQTHIRLPFVDRQSITHRVRHVCPDCYEVLSSVQRETCSAYDEMTAKEKTVFSVGISICLIAIFLMLWLMS